MTDETISVKGVKKDLYEKIKKIARESGKTIGEVTNESYKLFVSTTNSIIETGQQFIEGLNESGTFVISDISKLELSGEEIRKINKKISFRNIDNLKLRDITESDIDNYIASFVNIKTLEIPPGINKLKILEKSRFLGEIIQNK